MLNGVRLHFVRQGKGPPILLIHGWPGFWYEWHSNIPVLARQHTVIAPDLRGFAYSDKPDLPAEEGYTAEAAAGDLLGLLDRLGRADAGRPAQVFSCLARATGRSLVSSETWARGKPSENPTNWR